MTPEQHALRAMHEPTYEAEMRLVAGWLRASAAHAGEHGRPIVQMSPDLARRIAGMLVWAADETERDRAG